MTTDSTPSEWAMEVAQQIDETVKLNKGYSIRGIAVLVGHCPRSRT